MRSLIRLGACLMLAASASACSPEHETKANIPDEDPGPFRGVVSGVFVYGHEVRSFQPCGTHRVLWVQGSERLMTALRESHHVLTSESYEEVFVKLRGEELPKQDDGFAADYDGIWVVEEVLKIHKRTEHDCEKTSH